MAPPEWALDLQPGAPPVFGDIPWRYGDNRVTALARDPAWLFVYWELTDEVIARARAEVQAPDAPCILRVYDTTYRLFDGTNANWSMDVHVHRPANNHYVCVDRPCATLHVDIGVKSREGQHRIIGRWTIHYSWLTEGGTVRVETVPILRRILMGYRAIVVPSGDPRLDMAVCGLSPGRGRGRADRMARRCPDAAGLRLWRHQRPVRLSRHAVGAPTRCRGPGASRACRRGR